MSVTETKIPGGWTESTIFVGNRELSIVHPADPDAFLDELATRPKEEQEEDVYWAKLWQAAEPTAKLVWASRERLSGTCLELGCGVGLVGVAGLSIGLDVTFSDYHAMAVTTALENAARNGYPQAKSQLLDWREPTTGDFDVILACDVLYFEHSHIHLFNTIHSNLAQEGVCLIGDAGRFHAPKFVNLATDRGYAVRLYSETGDLVARPYHGTFQLIELRRKSARA